jgi:menaquinone-specific isochorismate synthase
VIPAVSDPAPVPGLVVRTVEIDDPGPLLDLLPGPAVLSWVRGQEGLVGWGAAARTSITGPSRFDDARRWWADVVEASDIDDRVGLAGTGLIAFGSFSFSDDAVSTDAGAGDGTVLPSTLVVPEVLIGRRDGRWWMTTASIDGASGPGLGHGTPPMAVGPLTWSAGACSEQDWKDAVAAAVDRIGARQLDKVVLARDRVATALQPIDPRIPLKTLALRYPTCWTFAVDGLIGATPEMLVRLHDGIATSRVLAGTIRRQVEGTRESEADAEVLADHLMHSAKDLREHEFSVRSVVDALDPHCVELTVPEAPFVLRLANVLHLATDITGVVTDGSTSLHLAEALHPTAAVCGAPTAAAQHVIADLEPMDRGRYAGPVGWTSADGDGEWGIALRCGQLDAVDPTRIRIFAGAGIVAASQPEAELAETIAKLAPMVEALNGGQSAHNSTSQSLDVTKVAGTIGVSSHTS